MRKRKNEEAEALLKISEKINSGLLLEDILNNVYESFHLIIPYNRIGVALLEKDQKENQIVKARWSRSDLPKRELKEGYSAPLKGSSLETILKTGKPRILNDLKAYYKKRPQSHSTELILSEGILSSLTCPLVAFGNPVGFIFFSSSKPNTYKTIHAGLFLKIAGQVSACVEKAKLYQKLADLNDLKNKFIGMASHDLKNKLVVIHEGLSSLLDGLCGEISKPQKKQIYMLLRKSELMNALLNDFLDAAIIESGTFEIRKKKIALPRLLENCYAGCLLLAKKKHIDLKMATEKSASIQANLDAPKITQVVTNLITNAVKFSLPNTSILIRSLVSGRKIRIIVQDHGQGIPKEEIPNLFQFFTKTSTKPTQNERTFGLGLAISKFIIEAHKGKISVESQLGKGSTFTISLPIGA